MIAAYRMRVQERRQEDRVERLRVVVEAGVRERDPAELIPRPEADDEDERERDEEEQRQPADPGREQCRPAQAREAAGSARRPRRRW